ncbi:MAG TPA: class I SAM-dependent methyltransferase [Pyrinomonadaceae bacterium]|jgi:ubiquinone/menaquinone biosynthesis C-methylase UbiE|nr:class I SAM-dependent methyltransferase [Pyrinomonadaceae bacterium]
MSAELFQQIGAPEIEIARRTRPRPSALDAIIQGLKRRWLRERRRRKVGRAYDMAQEIARVVPRGADVLDVGCGNGFIAHHLSAMLGSSVIGIDMTDKTQAPIDYRKFDGSRFPLPDDSVDAVLLCYVLHHAQDVRAVLSEMKRVLRPGGLAVIYEDIPETPWDRFICWTHNLQWRKRTGSCMFRTQHEWCTLFDSSVFEIVAERKLSRWRNFAHPVARALCIVRTEGQTSHLALDRFHYVHGHKYQQSAKLFISLGDSRKNR